MMSADEIFQAIQHLSGTERRRLLERVAHELGEAPPASSKQAAPPKPAVDRRAAIGMDAGKVSIAKDFDSSLPAVDTPQAETKPVATATTEPRPFGLCAGEFTTPDDFDAPLPDEILDAFEGR